MTDAAKQRRAKRASDLNKASRRARLRLTAPTRHIDRPGPREPVLLKVS